MSKVYIPMMPSRFDSHLNSWIPKYNTQAAEKYGEIIIMLKPDVGRAAIAPSAYALGELMKDFGPSDWVVAIGAPLLIGIACSIATMKCNRQLRVLQWDREVGDYLPIEVMVPA